MPRCKPELMTLRISLQEARVEVHLLRIRMFTHGCTCKSSGLYKKREKKEKQEGQEGTLLPRLRPRLPPTMRPFFKGQNNLKLCLFFCHSLVSQLTSLQFTVFSVKLLPKHSIPQIFKYPNIHSVSRHCSISPGQVF